MSKCAPVAIKSLWWYPEGHVIHYIDIHYIYICIYIHYTLYVYIIYTCIYTYTYVYSEVTFKLILSIKTFRLQYSIVNSLNIQYLIFNSSNILIMSTDSYTIDKSSFFIYFCFNFGIFYFLVIFLSFLKSKKPLEKQRQKYK